MPESEGTESEGRDTGSTESERLDAARALAEDRSEAAAQFLSGLANPRRLRILCQLTSGEKSVSELSEATGISQTSMSQHLAKLKNEGIVSFRREHRHLYYYISNPVVTEVMAAIYTNFCALDAAPPR
ncbi:ArsR/SmtB family transcription factor [Xanthobacter agilis]|jgi:DNA-binding transcriptional ArsR family regulator|uniref:ArsR/SmtB family transcription factor n=1 Tax=Xanthobacter agilis TaxID=47492 RepID=UPI00372BFB14